MSVVASIPPSNPTNYVIDASITIGNVINSVMQQLKTSTEKEQLKTSILSIKPIEEKNDSDKNCLLEIETSLGIFEKISLFALNQNGQCKTHSAAVDELKKKIKIHLSNKDNKNMLLISSGAFIDTENTQELLSLENNLLKIDQKFIVVQREGKFLLLPSIKMQTYTTFTAIMKESLCIISDEHDQRRKDGPSGFIFNLEQPKTLSKDEIDLGFLSEKEKENLTLQDQDKYLILFRNENDALAFKS